MKAEEIMRFIELLREDIAETERIKKSYSNFVGLQQEVRGMYKHGDQDTVDIEWIYTRLCECDVCEA